MADTMIKQTLATDGSWTKVASAPIASILLVGAPGQYEIYISDSDPADSDTGILSSAASGTFTFSSLDSASNLYARPTGIFSTSAVVLTGVSN